MEYVLSVVHVCVCVCTDVYTRIMLSDADILIGPRSRYPILIFAMSQVWMYEPYIRICVDQHSLEPQALSNQVSLSL